jgi:peptidoglycan biosynthesis protein MviN/MurJ (putative lipid II flippase)
LLGFTGRSSQVCRKPENAAREHLIIKTMFLKTGLLSILLLLASRLLGLLRESVQAAAFGTSGMGDVAALMLTLPDWLTGVLASGALAYVLLPHWAGQNTAQQAQSQRRVAHWLLALGTLAGLMLCVLRMPVSHILASGLPPDLLTQAARGLVWSAVALPAALLAALWVTRLQHEKDFTGLYTANLVVNTSLIVALYLVANSTVSISTTTLLGMFLCLAMGLRLLWLRWRLLGLEIADIETADALPTSLPRAPLWLWAALSAGLPLILPFIARSFASSAGEGSLVTFNYAWKLVELPLVLAVQMVATLAFPAISRAIVATSGDIASAQRLNPEVISAVRGALMLAWTLACAAAAALQVGAPAISNWLFGWGRMPAESLATVAAWGSIGAWSLLPQALIAVALTVLATLGRMRSVVLAYVAALVVMVIIGAWTQGSGVWLMASLIVVLSLVALVVLLKLPRSDVGGHQHLSLLPWQAMTVPMGLLVFFALAARGGWIVLSEQKSLFPIVLCGFVASVVIAVSYFFSSDLRSALRR